MEYPSANYLALVPCSEKQLKLMLRIKETGTIHSHKSVTS
jgi:hypothetical protein